MTARPPSAVSLSAAAIRLPMDFMASITSSAGITLFIPEMAMSAAIMAIAAQTAFLFTQGTSTRPAIGSHTKPSVFFNARALAWDIVSGVPPSNSANAPAAIAEALPHSAWHPPSAPDKLALFDITRPMAADVNKLLTTLSSDISSSSSAVSKTAGMIPHEPAVGAATTLPEQALVSEMDSALTAALFKTFPPNVFLR